MSYRTDDPWMGGYGGYSDGWSNSHRRPHDYHLDLAYYARICYDQEKGFQYLADAYNECVRKPDEAPLLPPPTLR